MDDDSVEAVLVASPDQTHADFAEYCIKRGIYLLLEKPLGLSLKDAEKVLKAEVNHGKRIVQVGLMRVFDNQHAAIKESIDKNSNYESANLHEDDILKDQNIFYDFIYSGSLFTTQTFRSMFTNITSCINTKYPFSKISPCLKFSFT